MSCRQFTLCSTDQINTTCLLQSVVFRVDYVVEQLGNREFGSVFLNEKENVAMAVVSNGWAKVSTGCFLTGKNRHRRH